MVTDRLRADHAAARDLLTQVGNSPAPSHVERAEALDLLARRWAEHGRLLDQVVRPALGVTRAWPDPTAAADELQREVEELAADLAAREGHGGAAWRFDFERLKEAVERQCRLEEMELVPALLRLPPDRLTDLALRAGGARVDPPKSGG